MRTLRFGERMRQLREERDLGVREVARQLKTSHTYVLDMERGKFLPTEDYVKKLAVLFGVKLQRMADWMVADRLAETTGEKTGVNWFLRTLDDLDERGQRQAIGRLLSKLADRKQEGEPWPDEFQVRRSKRSP